MARLGSRRAVSTFSRTRFAQGSAKSRVIGIGAGALRSRGPSNNGRTVPGTGTVTQSGGAPHDVFRDSPLRGQSLSEGRSRDCPRNGDCPLKAVAHRMTFLGTAPFGDSP